MKISNWTQKRLYNLYNEGILCLRACDDIPKVYCHKGMLIKHGECGTGLMQRCKEYDYKFI